MLVLGGDAPADLPNAGMQEKETPKALASLHLCAFGGGSNKNSNNKNPGVPDSIQSWFTALSLQAIKMEKDNWFPTHTPHKDILYPCLGGVDVTSDPMVIVVCPGKKKTLDFSPLPAVAHIQDAIAAL